LIPGDSVCACLCAEPGFLWYGYLQNAPKHKTTAPQTKTSFNRADSAGINERINAYFRKANENVGVFDCGAKIYERNLPEKLKTAIKNRDGNIFVHCRTADTTATTLQNTLASTL